MPETQEIFRLPASSPWKVLSTFFGSGLFVSFFGIVVSMLVVRIRSAGDIPWVTHLSLPLFWAGMLCLWALGCWLKEHYQIAYEFNPSTQLVSLTRTIAGRPFKVRLAEFSELHAVAHMCSWFDDKGARHWSYALCLVTKSAQLIRISNYSDCLHQEPARQIAEKLSIQNFLCSPETGALKARVGKDGQVVLAYDKAGSVESSLMQVVKITVFVTLALAGALLSNSLLLLFKPGSVGP